MEPMEYGEQLLPYVIANAKNKANMETMYVVVDRQNPFTMNEHAEIMVAMSKNPMTRAFARAENGHHFK